jgi:hypothetical protein
MYPAYREEDDLIVLWELAVKPMRRSGRCSRSLTGSLRAASLVGHGRDGRRRMRAASCWSGKGRPCIK